MTHNTEVSKQDARGTGEEDSTGRQSTLHHSTDNTQRYANKLDAPQINADQHGAGESATPTAESQHLIRHAEAIDVGSARHDPTHRDMDVERIQHEHRRAVDIVNGTCEDNGGPTQQNIIYESMSIERLEHAHRKAMDIEDGTCMDDGAGVMDCTVTRERMYADRLRRAYKHKRKLEGVRDHKSDAHATLTTENEWKRRRTRDSPRSDPQLPRLIPIPTQAISTTDPTHSTSISRPSQSNPT